MPRRVAFATARRRTFIKEWREFRQLTLERLADRLGMSKAQLSRIENGLSPYTQDFLEACAHALMTDEASLLMRDPSDGNALWSLWDQARPGEVRQVVPVPSRQRKSAKG